MLLGRGGQPQPWAIDAAATASMGHRCGQPAAPNSIDVPPMLLQPEPGEPNCPLFRGSAAPASRRSPPPGELPQLSSWGSCRPRAAGRIAAVVQLRFTPAPPPGELPQLSS